VNGDGFSDVMVGAYFYSNGENLEGRVFAYHGSAAGLASTPAWTNESNQAIARFGVCVATAGDVNGDGFSDVIVGAYLYDNGQSDEGMVFVYHGSAAGLASAPAWTNESNQANALFGHSVATAGDVNGDGFSDVIVGAYQYDNGQSNEGRAFVYHGSATGLATSPAWTAESNQASALLGVSVATAGDVNGDGFSDVIVGAPQFNGRGRAFVYHGSAGGLATSVTWYEQGEDDFGGSVASAGDVNGDGFSDVIIGARLCDCPVGDAGAVTVYHGSAAGLPLGSDWMEVGTQSQGWFGRSVATAGDVNGDGFSDVIIGEPHYSNGETEEGRALVYLGRAAVGLAQSPAWVAEGNQDIADLGFSVATAGDVNGDGFSDVIVGAFRYSNGHSSEGRALVYHGSAAGLAMSPQWTAEGNQGSAFFGSSVATAGDVNGDGFSDAIIGAPLFQSGEPGEGYSFLYYGNEGDGPDRIPRQARTDDSAPIWPLGNSDSDTSFRLKALGRTPAGRGDVRLQFEVKPAGVPFDGTDVVTGSVTDTGMPTGAGSAVPLTQLASGLTPETLYHWRLRVISDSPFFPRSPWMWLPYNGATEADVRTGEATTAVGGAEPHPTAGLWLAPGVPNPFNPSTTLSFLVPARTPVRLAIHDVQGRLVRLLVDEVLPAGQHAVEWDGRDGRGQELATGVYLSHLEAGGEVRSRKLALVK
jgi:hypothetical protein